MPSAIIQKSTLDFLRKLSSNNNREWFAAHKDKYEAAKGNVEGFIDALISKMNMHDQLETPSGRKSLYRIYNDVRFSEDKTPYKPRFAGYLRRVKPALRGGYYFWIIPGCSAVACGFASPEPADLKRIRQDIDLNFEQWNRLLKRKSIRENLGPMQGEKVATVPRGYDAGHPAIDLLRFKQFWFERTFTDQEVLAPDFLNNVNKTFKSVRPFFDYMSDVLTTDANGLPL